MKVVLKSRADGAGVAIFAVVAAILFIVPQALADLFQELAVSPALLRPPEGAVVPLLADP